MSTPRILSPQRKLNQKHIYIASWGGTAAYSGALVTSGFAFSLSTWTIVCASLAAISFASSIIIQRSWRPAFGSLLGSIAGIIGGGLLGGLVYLTEGFYPAVFTTGLGVAAIFAATATVQKNVLSRTDLARSCLHWAMFYSLLYAGISVLTGGLAAYPAYQPVFGAFLGIWATLMVIAFLES